MRFNWNWLQRKAIVIIVMQYVRLSYLGNKDVPIQQDYLLVRVQDSILLIGC